jgi:hypothetical protein
MSETKTYTHTLPLDTLSERLGNHLQGKHNCEVSYANDPNYPPSWCFIQTRRHGHVKQMNEKCIDITIQGTRKECKITIGSGEWGGNTFDDSKPLTPYKGILAKEGGSFGSLIIEKQIWKFLDKNT